MKRNKLERKKIERKKILLSKLPLDSYIFNNADPAKIAETFIEFKNKLLEQFKLQNTTDNPVLVVTETEHYGYDGAYDLYICAYQMEPLKEYELRVSENDKKIKEKTQKDILALQKKIENLKYF